MDIKLRHPFDGDYPVTQAFGQYSQDVINQFHLTTAYSQLHWGLDFGLPEGTAVLAADKGYVKATGEDSRSGKYIIVDHGNGFLTHYYHLSEQEMSAGHNVDRGQRIGLSGHTGMTTGPHLHFQLNVNGQRVDPTPFFGEYPQVEAPQFVSEILNAPEAHVDEPTTPMKEVGNTGNPENPGEWNNLSEIANKLGLPVNPTSYDLILLWNPELKTGSYDNIPSNMPVYVPETYNMPAEPVVLPEPEAPQLPTYDTYSVVEGDTLWDLWDQRGYNGTLSWADFKTEVANLNGGSLPHLIPGENINLPRH